MTVVGEKKHKIEKNIKLITNPLFCTNDSHKVTLTKNNTTEICKYVNGVDLLTLTGART